MAKRCLAVAAVAGAALLLEAALAYLWLCHGPIPEGMPW